MSRTTKISIWWGLAAALVATIVLAMIPAIMQLIMFGSLSVADFDALLPCLLASGILCGVIAGGFIYLQEFERPSNTRNLRNLYLQVSIPLADGETIIHSGGANHFKNYEAVGGRLFLLADRLHFCSHKYNLQNHELIIPLAQIKEMLLVRTLGLVPNGLLIVTVSGERERFVVGDRKLWRDKIGELLERR